MPVEDSFLTKILGKPSWVVKDLNEIEKYTGAVGPDSFAFAKVNCNDLQSARMLEEKGFVLIDTNIQFNRSNDVPLPQTLVDAAYEVRFAQEEDESNVRKVAGNSFGVTRFHLDPIVSNESADRIKSEWAGNFFSGKRGDWLVVVTFQDEVVGFLQLLQKEETIVIDLIAVDSGHRGKGLASSMIAYAAKHCGTWKQMLVGTQVSNIPSSRMYEKMGFRMCQTSYVFHYHGPFQIH